MTKQEIDKRLEPNLYILLGGGGNTRDFITFNKLVESGKFAVIVDDNKTDAVLRVPIAGTFENFFTLKRLQCLSGMEAVINCIGSSGDNSLRNEIYYKYARFIPRSRNCIMTDKISDNVTLGDNLLINAGVQIHHDCIIDSDTVISPGVILCGNVKIGRNCFIGAGAVIIQEISIPDNTIIGAGSIVIKDIKESGIYVGNPAKKIKDVVPNGAMAI